MSQPLVIAPQESGVSRDWRTLPLAIVGAGAAGGALAHAWHDAGGSVAAVYSRSAARAEALARELGARSGIDGCADAAIVVLAVPDAAIGSVAAAFPWRASQIAVHLAGALGVEALTSAVARGAEAVAWHPLCAFPRTGQARLPRAVRFGYSGPPACEELFATIAHDLGGAQIVVPNAGRTLYHAAAVLASNDLVALAASAATVLTRAGVPSCEALPALLPLMQSALDNLGSVGLPDALTGPLVRGDLSTVARHQAALRNVPEGNLYDALLAAAARLALQRADVPDEARGALARLIEEG